MDRDVQDVIEREIDQEARARFPGTAVQQASCSLRVIIGAVSVTLSLIRLELGSRIGATTGERGEFLGGLTLIGVGVATSIL
jgi:putative Mn2+ efflux pump MntP